MNKKVMLGMSGGVDSAMSAHILKGLGYDVTAVNCCFYKNENDNTNAAEDARAVSEKLGIGFTVKDMTAPFREKVIESFVDTYIKGGTPNPCIVCNRLLKFGAMLTKHLRRALITSPRVIMRELKRMKAQADTFSKKVLTPVRTRAMCSTVLLSISFHILFFLSVK